MNYIEYHAKSSDAKSKILSLLDERIKIKATKDLYNSKIQSSLPVNSAETSIRAKVRELRNRMSAFEGFASVAIEKRVKDDVNHLDAEYLKVDASVSDAIMKSSEIPDLSTVSVDSSIDFDIFVRNAKSFVSSKADAFYDEAYACAVAVFALFGKEFDMNRTYSDSSLEAVKFITNLSSKSAQSRKKIIAFFNRQPFVNQFIVS